MDRGMVDTRREIIALGNSVDGFATTAQGARDNALRRDYRATQARWPRGVTGGGHHDPGEYRAC
jgi:hypothetical protein